MKTIKELKQAVLDKKVLKWNCPYLATPVDYVITEVGSTYKYEAEGRTNIMATIMYNNGYVGKIVDIEEIEIVEEKWMEDTHLAKAIEDVKSYLEESRDEDNAYSESLFSEEKRLIYYDKMSYRDEIFSNILDILGTHLDNEEKEI